MKNLGSLQKVELREIWASESSDFTPWLARPENLKLLGDTIGIELDLDSQEKEVEGLFATPDFHRTHGAQRTPQSRRAPR